MLADFNFSCPIYIACGHTDLRGSWDTLADIVSTRFNLDPYRRALFLFCGRRKDRIKGLLWEGDGFLLVHKRFENKIVLWPEDARGASMITPEQYRKLMEGIIVDTDKLYPPFWWRE